MFDDLARRIAYFNEIHQVQSRVTSPAIDSLLASVTVPPGLYFIQVHSFVGTGSVGGNDHANIKIYNAADSRDIGRVATNGIGSPQNLRAGQQPWSGFARVDSNGDIELRNILGAGANVLYAVSLSAYRVA